MSKTKDTSPEPWDYCQHCGNELRFHYADQPCYPFAGRKGEWVHMYYPERTMNADVRYECEVCDR